MNTNQKFYQKSWFKNTILISIPCLISTIGVIISLTENLSKIAKNTLTIIIIVSMLILVFAVLLFANQDDKIYNNYQDTLKENEKLLNLLAHMNNDLKTSNMTIAIFSDLFENWSKNINTFANKVLNKQFVSDTSWDKIKYFDTICLQCKNMIKQYCKNEDNSKISVGFVQYSENEYGDQTVHMIAHSNPISSRPKACKKEQKLSESPYHYADLIKDEDTDIEVAVNNEEILRIFNKISKNTDLTKYCQYIAIPVYCTSNKLLGIFEIVTKYDYIIESERISLLKFAEEKIIPYSNLIVLVDKINKGLYVNPEKIQKEH